MKAENGNGTRRSGRGRWRFAGEDRRTRCANGGSGTRMNAGRGRDEELAVGTDSKDEALGDD